MPPTTLQTLPLELRLEVFRNVIPQNRAHYPYNTRVKETKRKDENIAPRRLMPPLTAVNRQIREETLELFFGHENAFCFFDLDTFEQWVAMLDNRAKLYVKHLAVSIPPSFGSHKAKLSAYYRDEDYDPYYNELGEIFSSSVTLPAKVALQLFDHFPNVSYPKLTINIRTSRKKSSFGEVSGLICHVIPSLVQGILTKTRKNIDLGVLTTESPIFAYPVFVNPNSDPEPLRQFWRCFRLLISQCGTSDASNYCYSVQHFYGHTCSGELFCLLGIPQITFGNSVERPPFLLVPSLHALETNKFTCIQCSHPLPYTNTFMLLALECARCKRGPYCSWSCLTLDEQCGQGCRAPPELHRDVLAAYNVNELLRKGKIGDEEWIDMDHPSVTGKCDEWTLLCLWEAIKTFGPGDEVAENGQKVSAGEEWKWRVVRPKAIAFADSGRADELGVWNVE